MTHLLYHLGMDLWMLSYWPGYESGSGKSISILNALMKEWPPGKVWYLILTILISEPYSGICMIVSFNTHLFCTWTLPESYTSTEEMSTPTALLTLEQLRELLNEPAGTPPLHVQPNFDNPTSLHAYVVLTLVLSLTISTVAVIVRMYTKLRIIQSLVVEDCMSLINLHACHTNANFFETWLF